MNLRPLMSWITLASCLFAGPAECRGEPPGCAQQTLGSRVVAVPGSRLSSLFGLRSADLRLWAFVNGERASVPFQIDECSTDGLPVLSAPGSAPREGVLGLASVLLFYPEDAGEASPRDEPAEVVGIEVGGSDGQPSRWAYLGRADGSLPPSERDYVDYDAEAHKVRSERYTLGFQVPYAAYFSVADGKGHDRGNLLDRLKARVDARFLWGLVTFRRNEEQVGGEVIGYRDGPIRVVLRTRLKVSIGWGIPSPEILADEYFYRDHSEGPITILLPFSLRYVFGDLDVRIYLDFLNLDGFEVEAEELRPPALVVGGSSRTLAHPPRTSWFALSRDGVILLHRLRFDRALDAVDRRLFYIDDPKQPDPPESAPGLRPAIGYRLTGWDSVEGGRHDIWMDMYVIHGSTAAEARAALARILEPVHVQVHGRIESGLVSKRTPR